MTRLTFKQKKDRIEDRMIAKIDRSLNATYPKRTLIKLKKTITIRAWRKAA